jgi:hypothetical protein
MTETNVRSQASWQPLSMFLCLVLIVATSFEIQALAKDLRLVSARKFSECQPIARSEGETGRSTNLEERTSRNHDESEDGGSDRPPLQALQAPCLPSAPSTRPFRRQRSDGPTCRSLPPSPPWTHRSRTRLRSCVLSHELHSLGKGNTR